MRRYRRKLNKKNKKFLRECKTLKITKAKIKILLITKGKMVKKELRILKTL